MQDEDGPYNRDERIVCRRPSVLSRRSSVSSSASGLDDLDTSWRVWRLSRRR